MYPKSIQKLIDIFSKFPGIGKKSAVRFVFYLLKLKESEIKELIDSISSLKSSIKVCSFCFNTFEGQKGLCKICSDPSRDRTLLCLVEKETDLLSIEKTKEYKGLYFISGETISRLKKLTVHTQDYIKKLRIKELKERISNPQKFGILNCKFKEIILALNPTIEGEATALYLERILKSKNLKMTRLARGLPIGGELEYADEETLRNALTGRK